MEPGKLCCLYFQIFSKKIRRSIQNCQSYRYGILQQNIWLTYLLNLSYDLSISITHSPKEIKSEIYYPECQNLASSKYRKSLPKMKKKKQKKMAQNHFRECHITAKTYFTDGRKMNWSLFYFCYSGQETFFCFCFRTLENILPII